MPGRLQNRSAPESYLGSVGDWVRVATPAGCSPHDHLVEQTVQQSPLLLRGEIRPGVEEIAVGKLVCEGCLCTGLPEVGACFVECLLTYLHAFNESRLSKYCQQSRVVNEQVEFVFGCFDLSRCGFNCFACCDSFRKQAVLILKRGNNLLFDVVVYQRRSCSCARAA